jgi:hypothetical protein
MNATLLIPRRKRRRPGWIARACKRIADYRYYRSLGQGRIESWEKAGKTI